MDQPLVFSATVCAAFANIIYSREALCECHLKVVICRGLMKRGWFHGPLHHVLHQWSCNTYWFILIHSMTCLHWRRWAEGASCIVHHPSSIMNGGAQWSMADNCSNEHGRWIIYIVERTERSELYSDVITVTRIATSVYLLFISPRNASLFVVFVIQYAQTCSISSSSGNIGVSRTNITQRTSYQFVIPMWIKRMAG